MQVRSEIMEQAEAALSSRAAVLAPFPRLAPTLKHTGEAPRFSPGESNGTGFGTNESSERRLLVIASRFPPVASVGATRVRKFVKYLGQFGWRPTVLTGAAPAEKNTASTRSLAADWDSLNDLPSDLQVHRLGAFWDNWPANAAAAIGRFVSRIPFAGARTRIDLTERAEWRLKSVHDALAIPDSRVWRIGAAVRAALKLHRLHRFNAIYSSGMPFSDHLIALALRKILCIPWISEFRDPWVEYIHWPQWKSPRGRRFTEWAESSVIRHASRVISVNDEMTARFASRYPGQPARKFVTIENGFDPDDFARIESPAGSRERASRFRLVYAGSLYDTRRPDAVLEAFRSFLEQNPGAKAVAQFDFIGRVGPNEAAFDRPEFRETVRRLGVVPHCDALSATLDADLNVIILPRREGGALDSTAKLYECLGAGRPILAAVPSDGAAARILSRHAGVSICEPDNVESIARAISHWFERRHSAAVGVHRTVADLAPLTRRFLTGRLAETLNEVAGKRRLLRG